MVDMVVASRGQLKKARGMGVSVEVEGICVGERF